MKLVNSISDEQLKRLIDHADDLCKTFDKASNCREFLLDKLNLKSAQVYYLVNNKDELLGLSVIELIDSNYGNLVMHTFNEKDEMALATSLYKETIVCGKILEIIQFRSNFNYRDAFIVCGGKEKERVRMVHYHIEDYKIFEPVKFISFRPILETDAMICGNISYNAHQYRFYIERYDVYSTPEKRAEFCVDLRHKKHGKSIPSASLIMLKHNEPIGVIEIVHSNSWNMDIGWIMDVALLPQHQGEGLGKHLIEKALYELYIQGYQYAGLGVTVSNQNACQLYQNLGFKDQEFFVEIIFD